MPDDGWLIEEGAPVSRADEREISRQLRPGPGGRFRGGEQAPHLAVRLHDLVIHDNKKWFGEADIRIDALVVQGNSAPGEAESFYQPTTFRFSRVADGDRLPIDGGLLVFHGRPLHFLDIALTVSRDRKDSDNLAQLIKQEVGAGAVKKSLGTLLGLAVAAPQVAVVTAAVGAAAVLADSAYRILQAATGATIGLYRASWLQHRDRFGLGRHPDADSHRAKDLSFWYSVERDE